MSIRPILFGAAGILALQLLTVRAASVTPVDPPKGWSISNSIGKQYRLGYDSAEKAYFIENAVPIEPAGKAINSETTPIPPGQLLPYSARGLRATEPWVAALLQSVKGTPFRKHRVRFQAEIKYAGFKGHFLLLQRNDDPAQNWSTVSVTVATDSGNWQTIASRGAEEEKDASLPGAERGNITFGFLIQGEGRVLIRNAKLNILGHEPEPEPIPDLAEIFDDPPAAEQPVNLELRP